MHHEQRATDDAFAGAVAWHVDEGIPDDHGRRAAAVEVQRLPHAEAEKLVGQLDERHADTRLAAAVDHRDVQRRAVAREAHRRSRVALGRKAGKGAFIGVGASGDVPAVDDDSGPAADEGVE
jgi:hypothetical protein